MVHIYLPRPIGKFTKPMRRCAPAAASALCAATAHTVIAPADASALPPSTVRSLHCHRADRHRCRRRLCATPAASARPPPPLRCQGRRCAAMAAAAIAQTVIAPAAASALPPPTLRYARRLCAAAAASALPPPPSRRPSSRPPPIAQWRFVSSQNHFSGDETFRGLGFRPVEKKSSQKGWCTYICLGRLGNSQNRCVVALPPLPSSPSLRPSSPSRRPPPPSRRPPPPLRSRRRHRADRHRLCRLCAPAAASALCAAI